MEPTESQAQAANDTTGAPAETPAPNPQSLNPNEQHDALDVLLANPDWKPEAPASKTETEAEAAPAGEQPLEIAAEEAETETPEQIAEAEAQAAAEAVAQAEKEALENHKGRFRFSDPADKKFAFLRKEGVAPDEAARIAYGIGKAQPEAAAEQEAEPDPLTAWQAELAEVDGKLAEWGASEGISSPDVVALIQKRGDLVADIKAESRLRERDQRTAAERKAEKQGEAVAQARTAQQTAVQTAEQRFPQLLAEGSAIRAEADRLLGLYRGSAFLGSADAPLAIAEQAAANVAKAQAAANKSSFEVELAKLDTSATAPAPKVATTAPKPAVVPPKVKLASGAQATQRPDQPATEQQKFGANASDSRSEHARLEALLYAPA